MRSEIPGSSGNLGSGAGGDGTSWSSCGGDGGSTGVVVPEVVAPVTMEFLLFSSLQLGVKVWTFLSSV